MSELQLYHGITLTETTKQRRHQIKTLQDEFMTFSWGGVDAFDSFGAFIINDKKGSLKFYNGPGFSNEYSKPQFDNSGGKILGVNFNKQTMGFTIGVYWISIEHYRLLIDWLNPLKTDYLMFGFDNKYRYNVKLSKIGDSTRWIVGHEMVDGVSRPMYYTELSLTFEVQGDACAKGINSYEWKTNGIEVSETVFTWRKSSSDNFIYTAEETLDTSKYLYRIYLNQRLLKTLNTEQSYLVLDGENGIDSIYLTKDKNYYVIENNLMELGVIESLYLYIDGVDIDNIDYIPAWMVRVEEDKYWEVTKDSTKNVKILTVPLSTMHDFVPSDLPTPFNVTLPLNIYGDEAEGAQIKYNLDLKLCQHNSTYSDEIDLFNVTLKNLTHTQTAKENSVLKLNISYNSQNGLVYLQYGNSSEKILTLLSLNDIGERIVDSISSWKVKLPGEFDYPNFYHDNNISFKLTITKTNDLDATAEVEIPKAFYEDLLTKSLIVCYPRTNLI